jgi:hypothetical protein
VVAAESEGARDSAGARPHTGYGASLGRTCRRNVARTLHVFDRPVEPAEIIAAFLMEGERQWVSVTPR